MDQVYLLTTFSPIMRSFILSEKVITILIAPLGEAKTFTCIATMMQHSARCGVPIRCAIIRDTLENIKLSIVPSIEEFFQEFFPDNPLKYYRFKNDYKELTIFAEHPITVDLFGIDDPASLSKLQGSSAYSLIWLNEPAPIADKANAGLSEGVYNVAVIRAVRHKGTPGRLLVDMNPADEEHWTHKRFIEEADFDPDFPLIQKQVWQVPYGDNKHLKDESRQAAKKMYANDPASYARYVEGQFAEVFQGEKVTPQYKRGERHRSPAILVPAKGLVSFAFFDSWHTPACVLGQITTTGRLIFTDTLRLENSDIGTLIKTLVIPTLSSPKWKGKPNSWRIGGDFTMKQPDQSDRTKSAARVVEKAFRDFLRVPGIFFEAGPSKWDTMKRNIAHALQDSDYHGEPLVLLSNDNKILHKALKGAWHFKTDNSGNVHKNVKPEKDIHSHAADAWANAVSVLIPTADVRPNLGAYRQAAARVKVRVQSYATGRNVI